MLPSLQALVNVPALPERTLLRDIEANDSLQGLESSCAIFIIAVLCHVHACVAACDFHGYMYNHVV